MERLNSVNKELKNKKDDGKKSQEKRKKEEKQNHKRKTKQQEEGESRGREERWKGKPKIFKKWLTLWTLLHGPYIVWYLVTFTKVSLYIYIYNTKIYIYFYSHYLSSINFLNAQNLKYL